MSREFTTPSGDAVLHEPILAAGDATADFSRAKERYRALGISDETLSRLFPEERTDYNPNQTRIPAGNPGGGQWTSGGGGTRGSAAFRESLINGTATKESILADPSFKAAADEVDRISKMRATTDQPGYDTDEYWENRKFVDPQTGEEIIGRQVMIDRLYEDSRGLAWANAKDIDGNPVAVPDTIEIRQDRQATILTGAPASGKSSIANPHARAMGAVIVDSDEAKRFIPEFRGGIGVQAVHVESGALEEGLMSMAMERGDNMVIPKVGHTVSSTEDLIGRIRSNGYTVTVVNVAVNEDEAWRRMALRWVKTGRLIHPSYMEKAARLPASTFERLIENNSADSFAQIDNNARRPQVVRGRVAGF